MKIALCFDDEYLHPALIWLHNLTYVTPREILSDITIQISYMPNLLSVASRNEIKSVAECLDLKIKYLDISYNLPHNALSVTEIPTFLVKFSKINLMHLMKEIFLYIDVDTLLLPGWHEIWNYSRDLEELEKAIAAVRDNYTRKFSQDVIDIASFRTDGILAEIHDSYFNSGVMLINPNSLPPISIENLVELWITIRQKGGVFFDQDVLNFLFAKNILAMDDSYNVSATDPFMWEASSRLSSSRPPKILHFCGQAKPWLQEISWKRDFALSLVDEDCSKPFRLVTLYYHLAEFRYRVFRRNFLL